MEPQPEPQPTWMLVVEMLIPGILTGPPIPVSPSPKDLELGWTTTDEGETW